MTSVYIHIPFCNKICTYCDFCKLYKDDKYIISYLGALNNEINKYYNNDIIKTLYIGGGTPSCLNKKELEQLFNIIRVFKLNKTYEFTFECNIDDICEDLLIFLKNNKVNRLSIGVQSFNKKLLKILGRDNNNVEEKITLAKKYFSNINIDLIYGINNESLNELKNDLNHFIKLNITHISIYSLILEENTILKVSNYKELDDDSQRIMYDYIRKFLKKNEFKQYEISNFSKKGYESKHNLTYWNNESYYGFGLGASGFINNIRYTNTKNINKYNNGDIRYEEKIMSLKENMENEMILGLRKIKGVSKRKFYKKYHKNVNEVFNVCKVKENKYYYYIPSKHLFVSNYILSDFIDI